TCSPGPASVGGGIRYRQCQGTSNEPAMRRGEVSAMLRRCGKEDSGSRFRRVWQQHEDNRSMSMLTAFYAQSDGVAAVINATACVVIETARKNKSRIGNVYAGRNGIIGALTEDMIDTNRESARTIAALRHTPGGAFGSARYKLKGIEENRAQYERLVEVFRAH